jgi:uncharacterized protein (TIGR03437 family)
MGGAAPAADAEGNIYAVSGNGRFDGDANGPDLGDSVIKLSSPGLTVLDSFTPFNQLDLDQTDIDLGSGGAVLLPDAAGSLSHPRLMISAGKEGRIYLLDRDRMGRFRADADSQIVQSIAGALGPVFGGPAYFNGALYFSPSEDKLKAFSVSGAHIESLPLSQSSGAFYYPGAVPAVSANGALNGIVWIIEGGFSGTLHAFDASNLANELYNSQLNSSRDALGSFVKFSVPTIANGRVYVGTKNALAVFGLLHQASPTAILNAASLQPGPVAPGSLITIVGSNLASATMTASSASLPRSLGGVTLSVNGIAVPLLYVSAGQINAQVPFEAAEGWAKLLLQRAGEAPVPLALLIAATAPGLFPAIRNPSAGPSGGGSENSPDNPASVGSVVTVYLTGQGAVAPAVQTGEPGPGGTPARAVFPLAVTVGNRQAIITFAGLVTDSAGLFQIDFLVPGAGTGERSLVVTVNGVASNGRPVSVSDTARVRGHWEQQ